VAILGGGVGGLSAAHELAERGFDVTVYEWRQSDDPDSWRESLGGKARSMPVPGSGTGGRADLPAEHGFRFFPGFYRHVVDTMERIPHRGGNVADHLVDATRILMAQACGRNELIAPARLPSSSNDVAVLAQFMWDFATQVKIPLWEIASLFERLITLLVSCDERRYGQWENVSWWEFTGAAGKSKQFQKFMADGLTRSLVAAQGDKMSARTGGLIVTQIMLDMMKVNGQVDRVLDGPTSEVWIRPWVERLEKFGVKFRTGCRLTDIHTDGCRVTGAVVTGEDDPIVKDYYISAIPVEKLVDILPPQHPLCLVDPQLARLKNLTWRWMNGAMFYLDKDVALQHGHAIFIDSEWALTAISQAQFWPDIDLEDRGNGEVDGILSVDIAEWERPSKVTGRCARDCTEEQILDEVWRQLCVHIDDGSLQTSNVVARFLDPAIQFPNASEVVNVEPLLVNTKGSWADRPEAATALPNFFLASDFVRTHTDLATMEAANEAARRAVNGILDDVQSGASRCKVWKLREPRPLAPLRALDRVRWELEKPVRSVLQATPGGSLIGGLLGLR
jgi:uncharacterized protein with NAD-binding domain and iron-sulfur cluster